MQADLRQDFSITLTLEQVNGVKALLSGKDVVAAMPTGSGKSLIFQSITYSAVKRGHGSVTLVVTPLKAISFTHVQTFRDKVSVVMGRHVYTDKHVRTLTHSHTDR